MWYILRLVNIVVKSESTCEINFFLKLFNEVLSHMAERDYKFDPKLIIVDMNNVNYSAIKQVFGLGFLTSKVVSCQMDYKSDVNKASLRIGMNFKDEFKIICNEMCTMATVA